MRTTVYAIAFLALAGAAQAKTWADLGCSVSLISEGKVWTIKRDGEPDVTCTIKSWPISQPDAVMSCSDGTEPVMTLVSDDELVFGGVQMVVPSDENGVCD